MSNELASMDECLKWGELAKKAAFVPQAMTPQQAAIIVEYGREMGIPPIQALKMMSFIQGKLCMEVQMQLALARKVGVTIKSVESTATFCKVTLIRGSEEVSTEYTIEQAKNAGLVREGSTWIKHPTDMLWARACGRGLKRIASDAVLGLLSPDEAEEIAFSEPISNAKPYVEMPKEKVIIAEITEPEKPIEPKAKEKISYTDEDVANLFKAIQASVNTDELSKIWKENLPLIKVVPAEIKKQLTECKDIQKQNLTSILKAEA